MSPMSLIVILSGSVSLSRRYIPSKTLSAIAHSGRTDISSNRGNSSTSTALGDGRACAALSAVAR